VLYFDKTFIDSRQMATRKGFNYYVRSKLVYLQTSDKVKAEYVFCTNLAKNCSK